MPRLAPCLKRLRQAPGCPSYNVIIEFQQDSHGILIGFSDSHGILIGRRGWPRATGRPVSQAAPPSSKMPQLYGHYEIPIGFSYDSQIPMGFSYSNGF